MFHYITAPNEERLTVWSTNLGNVAVFVALLNRNRKIGLYSAAAVPATVPATETAPAAFSLDNLDWRDVPTTHVAEYLDENGRYMDRASRAVVRSLNDAQFSVLFDAFNILTASGSEVEPGIDCKLVRTAETLDDFDDARASQWHEKGNRIDYRPEIPAVEYQQIQMQKGRPRQNISVADLGAFRVVLL
ncbi:hypothetical protein [Breoghania sp.]|uniref:hypothetical protein n=1 Tax=Breoghania sp. TaxID=2065378 RepID=UPI002AA894AC|nr:hypothetical protein [Breoghania sp.]